MNVHPQEYLTWMEDLKKIAFFDIEASGLNGDYNSVLCVSVKPYGRRPFTYTVDTPGDDHDVVEAAVESLSQYSCIVGYYSSGFDVPMLRTRMLSHGMGDFPPIYHIDLYFKLRSKLKMARKSQAQVLAFLRTPEQKMGVAPEMWNRVLSDPRKHMPTMVARCESDVKGLEAAYRKTRHLIKDIKREGA